MSKRVRILCLLLIFFVLSVVITYPAFMGGFFKATMDGEAHLYKMNDITAALRSGRLPQFVNYEGYSNTGMAFNGMYPWIANLIFIIPRLIVAKPVTALAIGLVLLNMLTMINAYLLARKLTSNLYWRLLGVFIYEFNAYHLTVIYGRNAWGEALAYVFMPLVFLGCIQIWQNDKWGILSLGLGMGMIANSHMISVLYTLIFIIVAEVYRLCSRSLTFREVRDYIFAGIIAFLVSCYSIINIGILMLKNDMVTPWKALHTIDPLVMIQSAIRNTVTDVEAWSIGIVAMITLFVMGAQLLKKNSGSWRVWIISAFITLILITSWIPYPTFLKNSFFGNLQFVARLYTYVVMFLVIGLLIYLENNKVKLSAKNCLIIATSLLVLTGASGVLSYHKTTGDHPIRFYLDNNNYHQELSRGKDCWYDYMVNVDGKWAFDIQNLPDDFAKDSRVNANAKMITFDFESKRAGNFKLPFVLYNGVDYQVTVNGKRVKNFEKDQTVYVAAKKGNNSVTVTSKVPSFTYITFSVSILTIIIGTVLLLRNAYKENNQLLS